MMPEQRQAAENLIQPARAEPIGEGLARPPLDWGVEDPDLVWERLYHRGLVDPPYRSVEDRVQVLRDHPPLDFSWPTDQMLRDLGRLPCAVE